MDTTKKAATPAVSTKQRVIFPRIEETKQVLGMIKSLWIAFKEQRPD